MQHQAVSLYETASLGEAELDKESLTLLIREPMPGSVAASAAVDDDRDDDDDLDEDDDLDDLDDLDDDDDFDDDEDDLDDDDDDLDDLDDDDDLNNRIYTKASRLKSKITTDLLDEEAEALLEPRFKQSAIRLKGKKIPPRFRDEKKTDLSKKDRKGRSAHPRPRSFDGSSDVGDDTDWDE